MFFIRIYSIHVGLMLKKKSIGSLILRVVICSIEIEVPFIIKCFGPSVKIVPIMVGRVSPQLKRKYAKYFVSITE